MARGGRRPGSGRKASPQTIEFRAFWREWLDSPAGRKHLIARVKKSDTLLGKIIDKCHASPTELDISFTRIPKDFTFRCELSSRGGAAPAAPVAVPEGDRRVSGD